MSTLNERLATQSATKSFFQYFIPTLLGMMLMSINVVVDGIFVGNGVGSVALASVNVAVPVFSIIISIALLIGVGGGTLYSMAMGEGNQKQAQGLFTISFIFLTLVTVIIALISYVNMDALANLFGANEETLPYTVDYMRILLIFSVILAWENFFSIFVRNDGDPQLAMIGLVVSALLNIVLDYWMIFILNWEVTGAALATVIATFAGLVVYLFHFFKKDSGLKFIRTKWNMQHIKQISAIGMPSFLSEAGTGVFVMGYNIAIAYYAGTTGLAAFSVINYLHTFMFLAFIGIGQSIQPMISFYYGAKQFNSIKETVKVAEITGLALGVLFLGIGYIGADFLVSIFGVASSEIAELAAKGIKLFFLGYLFMGTNFIYMTYYQSIGYVRPSVGITLFRGFILLIGMLFILPLLFGTTGIWLALPVAEGMVAITLMVFARNSVMRRGLSSRGF
ncbi:MATE family efflux transporter [Virgibacillus dakarensis]|uniref:Multidrug export protein MepA n=1 Tax=Lentibacillus populi TaxID=1827502 RepID=A0A9W5TY02_9BACI|nr:MATE family efflux transporter [Lentibacillus populi]MBT2217212.1 MATE family efflux transporter [Virgibacillus dakarensis]MTW85786.1 MATE family efflux transporter [Virgibacillus dakarensis]GGB43216.1 multidrug efflux MATE transporter FepA [Lentibacillus populi]